MPDSPNKLYSTDAERAVLGAILQNNAAYHEAAARLSAEDFSLSAHRVIFRRISDLIKADRAVDLVTLIEELDRRRELPTVGDVGYVSDLLSGVPERPSINQYVSIVKEKAQLRGLVSACQTTIERACDGDRPAEASSGLLRTVLEAQASGAPSQGSIPKEFMTEVKNQLEQQSKIHGLVGLPTGLDSLDRATGGLRNGELVIVGARPGAGKSALACQILATNGGAGNAAHFFSLEMSRLDIGRRFLAMLSDVGAHRLRHPQSLREPDWQTILTIMCSIAEWPVVIDDSGDLSLHGLLARAKMAISKGAKLIVVDYLQLVSADGRDLRERIGNVTNGLRLLAKAEHVPIVALSQLRRPQNVNDEPTLIELKESGDIEAHAHVVLLIHSPIAADGSPSGEDRIIIAKDRNGPRGAINVYFKREKLRFYSRYKNV
jgi:replicative DNA helicase